MTPRFNMHVHTFRSACAKPEMVLEAIDSVAVSAGLEYIGLSDHIDVPSDNRRPEMDRSDVLTGRWDSEFLIGCEATVLSPGRFAVTDEVARSLDYVMVSANHYHLSQVQNPQARDARSYAQHYLRMLRGVIEWGLADIVAHPFLHTKIGRVLDPLEVLNQYDWDDLEDLLEEAGAIGLAFEIKPGFGSLSPDFFGELVRAARRFGVKFSLGGDSHRLREIPYPDSFGEELDRLGIRERDLINPRDYLSRER